MFCVFCEFSAVQSQKAVSDYFTSKQILPFGFAEQYCRVLMQRRDKRDAGQCALKEYVLYPAYREQVANKYTNISPSVHIHVETCRICQIICGQYVTSFWWILRRLLVCIIYRFSVRDENENITLLIICQIICGRGVSLYLKHYASCTMHYKQWFLWLANAYFYCWCFLIIIVLSLSNRRIGII